MRQTLLRVYRAADLRLCFRICEKAGMLMHRQTESQIERQTEVQMDGRTDRQTFRYCQAVRQRLKGKIFFKIIEVTDNGQKLAQLCRIYLAVETRVAHKAAKLWLINLPVPQSRCCQRSQLSHETACRRPLTGVLHSIHKSAIFLLFYYHFKISMVKKRYSMVKQYKTLYKTSKTFKNFLKYDQHCNGLSWQNQAWTQVTKVIIG